MNNKISLIVGLSQGCPTHLPLATCGEWPLKVANGFISKNFKNMMFLENVGISRLIYPCSATKP